MNSFKKTILIAGFTLLSFSVSPVSLVSAQVQNLVVGFEQTPLFSEANFLPGEKQERKLKGFFSNSIRPAGL